MNPCSAGYDVWKVQLVGFLLWLVLFISETPSHYSRLKGICYFIYFLELYRSNNEWITFIEWISFLSGETSSRGSVPTGVPIHMMATRYETSSMESFLIWFIHFITTPLLRMCMRILRSSMILMIWSPRHVLWTRKLHLPFRRQSLDNDWIFTFGWTIHLIRLTERPTMTTSDHLSRVAMLWRQLFLFSLDPTTNPHTPQLTAPVWARRLRHAAPNTQWWLVSPHNSELWEMLPSPQ